MRQRKKDTSEKEENGENEVTTNLANMISLVNWLVLWYVNSSSFLF